MQRVTSFALDEDFGRRSGLTGGVPVEIHVLQLGTGEAAAQWKLMTFGARAEGQAGEFIQHHTGMQYITVLVTDLRAMIDRLGGQRTRPPRAKTLYPALLAYGGNESVITGPSMQRGSGSKPVRIFAVSGVCRVNVSRACLDWTLVSTFSFLSAV